MKIAVGNSRMDRKWKNKDISWNDFISRVSTTIRTTETVSEFRKMSRAQQDTIKDVGGFVGGALREGKRRNGYVLCRSLLTLDMDYAKPGIWEQIETLHDFKCCIYSTHKHTSDAPRLRLLIPLKREVTEDEYPALGRMVAKEIGIDFFDDTTYEPSRLMYWPSTSSDGEFVFKEKDGELLDPDMYLAKYTDWRDTSMWPVSSRQSEVVQRKITKQADPLSKEGVVGAFCRAYTIEEAIDTFLQDVYEPSTMNGRYDYIPADSSAGLVIYDGKFAYSHHATDPACGMLLNAFDLVRVHKFRDLDEKTTENTAPSKLPSFRAMTDLALKDERVKEQFAEERRVQAESEFIDEDWEKQLELDKTGAVKNTLRNLILILENDPNLKSIVFNQLSDSLEIKGDVPWPHPSRFWRDADDAQLISYIDTHYGTFSARNYDVAVAKVADDRSYHPIREFIEALPEWDKVPRVDSLLIDYLGASDNPYVRAVTRKNLCAAIARVLTPGIKFDSMLVLNGPQGVGKSTLIAKLGGDWFSDSLSLSDTKDKTAAEKLQGYWILEIGELAGLKKAEVETLRSFLSRQNDIYRASFGRRATPHLRQCVFFGTTNAEKGYLRDTTGNRRFWPVKTPGNGTKKSWQLTQDEILQIWAEALTFVKAGEKLYLDASLEKLAKDEQREAMESDEREGLVREYLDMLLPEDWDTMDLYERRAFINGTEFGESQRVGVKKRTSVSNMEIWCECFGKDRANLRRMDGNEISAIMAGIGGWSGLVKKERISLYGPQWVYVPKP
ncbi:virulence-associated E family protein [Paenibacillus sp. FSL M7-1455]|uniref:virulence-associated E family protein n=1 Tax=Paenibacillus sp. FSL M7-1455 TaxID=2975316 RepID=UPI0030F75ACA